MHFHGAVIVTGAWLTHFPPRGSQSLRRITASLAVVLGLDTGQTLPLWLLSLRAPCGQAFFCGHGLPSDLLKAVSLLPYPLHLGGTDTLLERVRVSRQPHFYRTASQRCRKQGLQNNPSIHPFNIQ